MNGDAVSGERAPKHVLRLPDAPASLSGPVKAWEEDVSILTYLPAEPDPNPMFLEKRVYQGSSGRVYPLPFIDRIATEPQTKLWKAVHIENEFLRLMILPEIGGRIHIGYDKTNDYDFFYRQDVIKPALVGLAGPWISGGVEFNWPQHHRPATFMPVTTEIQHHPDGSVTVWCSDHDPMLRMKGMHGVCLHPDRAVLELKVRLYNRTALAQSFLWWANVATRVHERYQSFFPPDVRFVADHAKRAITSFPLSSGIYYGVDYGERAERGVPAHERPSEFVPDGSYPPNDLSWYSNIPVPTSYMVCGTEADFFGGYDHAVEAGVIHVANHHIAPGKKQWTWGNHEFGYSWDRCLTDEGGPYIELMAGVYTDNQPDFSHLAAWETKTFTQNWFPIRRIGIPQAANVDATLSLRVEGSRVRIGVCVSRQLTNAIVVLGDRDGELGKWTQDISVSEPALITSSLPETVRTDDLRVAVYHDGRMLLAYKPEQKIEFGAPSIAEEPPDPEQIESIEELYLTGLHLEQYRHATRLPELYWQEVLRRDPGESRAHNRMGLWHLRRGELDSAREHFELSIRRLTRLNPNPNDGEPYYNLGLTLRYLGLEEESYAAFYKATWNAAWRAPSYFALAEIDASRSDWAIAADHLRRSLAAEAENSNAICLLAQVLRKQGDPSAAEVLENGLLSRDPLDIGGRWQRGIEPANGQERLDLAFDFMRSGQEEEAMRVLHAANLETRDGAAPMILLVLAHLQSKLGRKAGNETFARLTRTSLEYAFPNRLEEMLLLEAVAVSQPDYGGAFYMLGNFLYDRRRHAEAIAAWEKAAALMPALATVWRNLGIGYFNYAHDTSRAIDAFDRALAAHPQDGRILYERDQLWKRVGKLPEQRIDELLTHLDLVERRDDLSLELAALYNQLGRPQQALERLLGRHFQPWEGGEGLVLAQFVRARLLLGRSALDRGDPDGAMTHFEAALKPPQNLGEARHLLANRSDIYYWLGVAFEHQGSKELAQKCWRSAATHQGDFQQMSVRAVSEMTYWSALAEQKLGSESAAEALLQQICRYSVELEAAEPKIDYFATSLPAMLLFEEDIRLRNQIEAYFLRAQALAGLGRIDESKRLLEKVLHMDRNHAGAADLMQKHDGTLMSGTSA
jgi:tetratricopeptide (TPR) repeat protein